MPAQFDYAADVLVGDSEPPVRRLRLIDEQFDGAVSHRVVRRSACLGYRQRAEPEHPLALDLQRDLAGDEQPHAWRTRHDGVGQPRHLIDQMLRDAHTLKGSSRMVGLIEISDIAHRLEDIMVKIRDGVMAFTPDMSDFFFEALDTIVFLAENARIPVDDRCWSNPDLGRNERTPCIHRRHGGHSRTEKAHMPKRLLH